MIEFGLNPLFIGSAFLSRESALCPVGRKVLIPFLSGLLFYLREIYEIRRYYRVLIPFLSGLLFYQMITFYSPDGQAS